MKTIKFRGIRIDGKGWTYGDLVINRPSGSYMIIDNFALCTHANHSDDNIHKVNGDFHLVDPKTVGQFTGLIDNNGTEIYEGDILKAHGIVAWNDTEHRWSAIDLNWNDKREWHDIDYLTSPFEVIGSIHQNPELLES